MGGTSVLSGSHKAHFNYGGPDEWTPNISRSPWEGAMQDAMESYSCPAGSALIFTESLMSEPTSIRAVAGGTDFHFVRGAQTREQRLAAAESTHSRIQLLQLNLGAVAQAGHADGRGHGSPPTEAIVVPRHLADWRTRW